MRPHDMAADLQSVLPRLATMYPRAAGSARELLIPASSQAVTFDITGIDQIDNALIQFGRDLFIDGLFRLPFEHVFFTRSADDGVLAWLPPGDHGLMLALVTKIKDDRAGRPHVLPWMIVNLVRDTDKNPRILTWPWPASSLPLDDKDRRTIENAIDSVLGLTVLLSSRLVERTVTPPPASLNKQREKKGKPPIRAVIRISLNHALRTTRSDQRSGRASPVPHWRRGHIRRLADGKVVPIAPTIVGLEWQDETAPPLPKRYELH